MSLEDVREKKNSIGLYVVIGLLLIGMAGFGTQQFGTGGGGSSAAALSLGDSEVTQQRFNDALRDNRQNYPDVDNATIEEVTLSQLRQGLALDNYLQKYPLVASNRIIDNDIRNNPGFYENGQFSEAVFRKAIRVEPQIYRQAISNHLAQQTFQRTLSETGVVSQAEVMPYFELQNLSRDILVAKLARSAFPNTANESEIQAFYDDNKADYQTEEQISFDYIELNPEQIVADTAVSDAEIMTEAQTRQVNYYAFTDEQSAGEVYNKVNTGNEAKAVLTAAADRIEDQGELDNIAAVVNEESLISQAAVDAIFDLQSVGQLTAPITVDGTVYVFELTGEPKTEMTETEKRTAKTMLQEKKALPKITVLSEKLNQAVFEQQSPSLENISQATGLPVQQNNLQAINSGEGILAVKELAESIKNSDKTTGKLQDPVTVGERVIIYRLTEVKAPQQKPLDDVKSEVETAVIAKKTDEQLTQATEQLLEQAKTSGFEAAAKAADYPTQSYAEFKGQVEEGGVLDPIGALFIMQQTPQPGDDNAQHVKSVTGDVYVYVNTDVRLGASNGESDMDDEMKNRLTESLSERLGQMEFSQFLQSITSRADIKMRTGLLQNNAEQP